MKKAFTLTELLVVMGIVLSLAGVLLPVLAAARARAKTAVCISNVRQVYLATALYSGDADTLLPFQINDNRLLCEADPGCAMWPPVSSTFPAELQAGLRPYGAARSIFECPYAQKGSYLVNPGFGDYVYSFPVPRGQRNQWPWVASIDDAYIQNSALWADDRISFDVPQHPDKRISAAFPDGHIVNRLEKQFAPWYPD